MRRLAVLAALLVLGGCSAGGSPASTTTAPDVFTVTGTLTLPPGDYQAVPDARVGAPCTGKGGYDDMTEGAQVVVADGDGSTVAVGALAKGVLSDVPVILTDACVFAFTVPDVPNGLAFYSVEVGSRGALTYTRADLDAELVLTLG